MEKIIYISEFKHFKFYNITRNTRKEVKFLKKHFDFQEQDIESILPPIKRPKIIKNSNYIFLTLLFPYYNRQKKEVRISEVDFFIKENLLILVHENKIDFLQNLKNLYFEDEKQRDLNSFEFLYELLEQLMQYCFPMLTHIGQDIDELEEHIFDESRQITIKEILLLKRNIINFRRAMQTHKNILKKLLQYTEHLLSKKNLHISQNIIELTRDIWDLLDNYTETIFALHGTNESMINLRLNQIMKMLTIISVITFPLTLLAALFSTNLQGTPFVNQPFGFWILVFIMLNIIIIMLLIFKMKKWF